MRRALIVVLLAVSTWALAEGKQTAQQLATGQTGAPLTDPFAAGWMVADTNGDGIADALTGKIVVPENPTAAENAAAANLAARVAYASTGLTLPLVVTVPGPSAGPRIWIGRAAPESATTEVRSVAEALAPGEGGVFAVGENLAVVGDDAGLGAAADGFAARAPYQWRVSGDKLTAIADAVNGAGHGSGSQLAGVTYMRGEQGIHRAILRAGFALTTGGLAAVFSANPSQVAAVRQLVVVGGRASVTAANPKPLGGTPAAGGGAANADATADAQAGGGAGGAGAATHLDLATVYTSRGLFTGTARMPLPSSSDAHLYVPAGVAGTAMANLAARMGLETIGITLPIASPAADISVRQVRTQAVIAGDSPLAQEVDKKLRAEDNAASQADPQLGTAEGELRVVDDSFGRRGAILVRGDQAGSAAAIDLLAGHFPNVWEPGKPYQSLEEIRYDLHRFFSLRSGAGQASAELYTLAQWMKEIKQSGPVTNVKAEVYADLADPGLAAFVQKQIQQELGVASATVKAGSLRAGTQCCDQIPDLHFETPGYPYHQGTPTFAEDLVIPWEGTRLLNAVQGVASKVKAGQDVKLLARVSEGIDQRQKLQARIEEMLTRAGADKRRLHIEVLCAFKPGLSWLMDEIAPDLVGKGAAAIQVQFAKDVDPSGTRTMYSPSRWLHELYPVDEMLALKLKMPREKITFSIFEPTKGGPTYRVRATDVSGAELLSREFSVPTVMQPYNGVIKSYEQVEVDTGWVRLDVGSEKLLDERIMTDLEMFWDHYQNKTLPDVYHFVMAQAHGNLREEFAPPFDTLKMDIHMSEPEYQIAGVDHERVSALEALQEDTFYSTANFVEMWGRLETGQQINHIGRVIPVVHPPLQTRGRTAMCASSSMASRPRTRSCVWRGPIREGKAHERERAIPVLTGDMMPRLIQAQTKARSDSIENLTWLLPADYKKDDFEQWSKVERRDQVDRTIFSVEKASGELRWLEQMHAAGVYQRQHRVSTHPENGRRVRAAPGIEQGDGCRRAKLCELERAAAGESAADDRRLRGPDHTHADRAVGRSDRLGGERRHSGAFCHLPRRNRVLDGAQLPGSEHLGCRHHAAVAVGAALVGEGKHVEGERRVFRPPAC